MTVKLPTRQVEKRGDKNASKISRCFAIQSQERENQTSFRVKFVNCTVSVGVPGSSADVTTQYSPPPRTGIPYFLYSPEQWPVQWVLRTIAQK